MHLSFPYAGSVNDFIDPDKATTQYQHFDHAIQLVEKHGQFCWIAKGDVQSAFRIAPIKFKHIRCLGIKFEGQYFVDITLPFGSAISCAIFEDIATLVHWIFKQCTGVSFVHYLDDYLWVHRHYIVCLYHMYSSEANLPGHRLTPGPSQVYRTYSVTRVFRPYN